MFAKRVLELYNYVNDVSIYYLEVANTVAALVFVGDVIGIGQTCHDNVQVFLVHHKRKAHNLDTVRAKEIHNLNRAVTTVNSTKISVRGTETSNITRGNEPGSRNVSGIHPHKDLNVLEVHTEDTGNGVDPRREDLILCAPTLDTTGHGSLKAKTKQSTLQKAKMTRFHVTIDPKVMKTVVEALKSHKIAIEGLDISLDHRKS